MFCLQDVPSWPTRSLLSTTALTSCSSTPESAIGVAGSTSLSGWPLVIGALPTMHAASAPLSLAAGLIPDAQLEWLDDVAHLPHLEGDSVTLDVIADFVDSLAGGG
jgi:hypothetical protein